jgi:hypothetical protein
MIEFLVEQGANIHADDDYPLRLAAELAPEDGQVPC